MVEAVHFFDRGLLWLAGSVRFEMNEFGRNHIDDRRLANSFADIVKGDLDLDIVFTDKSKCVAAIP